MAILFSLWIVIFLGIVNAWYLYWQYKEHVRSGRAMVCPVGGKCEEVVASSYGTTLGVKNEISGLFYYFSLLALLLIFMFSEPWADAARILILVSSAGAVIFSTYLLYAQLLVLREYCSWCVAATVINYAIMALEILYFF